MYTAQATYQNDEIGFGEGMSDHYAVEECIESIPQIYKDAGASQIRLIVRRADGDIAYVTSIAQYAIDTE